MTQFFTPKVAAGKVRAKDPKTARKAAAMARTTGPKTASKVAAGKARTTDAKTAPKAAPMARTTDPKTASKVAAGKARTTDAKTAPKALPMARITDVKTASKAAAGVARTTDPVTAPKAAPMARTTNAKTAPKAAAMGRDPASEIAAQFEKFAGDTPIPDSMRALAEKSMAQTRELYERSLNTLQSALESCEKLFGAAGQGAVALNRMIIEIADRNINSGFDLATSLAGAKNLGEVIELQAAYWRRQFGDLSAQAAEVRAPSTEVTPNEPIKAHITRPLRQIKSTQH